MAQNKNEQDEKEAEQNQIKDAVTAEDPYNPYPPEENASLESAGGPQNQQFIAQEISDPAYESPQAQSPEIYQQDYPQTGEQYPTEYSASPDQQYQQGYDYQQYSSPQLSPDTITEISEQAITERLSPIQSQIEKIKDLHNSFSAQVESLSSRLLRIEKVIDRLQLSILQKMGDYAENVGDIKKELIETQKSFKSLHSSSHSPHHKKR